MIFDRKTEADCRILLFQYFIVQSYRQDLAMDDEILPSLGDPKLEYGMGAVIHGEGAVTNLDFHR